MINEIFSKLDQETRDLLVASFNNQEDCLVDVEDTDYCIGVFVSDTAGIEVIETKNNWIIGKRTNGNNGHIQGV